MNREADGTTFEPMPFVEFMAQVRARRAGALWLFAAVFGAALLIAALLPPLYRATAILAVLPAPEFTVRQDAGSHTLSTSALAMDQVMSGETRILQSSDLEAGTLRALGTERLYPGLDPATAAWPVRVLRAMVHVLLSPWRATPRDPAAARFEAALRRFDNHLLVLPTKDSNVIEVRFGHRDPQLAADAVNELLARYARHRERLYDDPQLAAVRRETGSLSTAVRDADSALAEFKAAHAIADYDTERGLLVRRQSDAGQALADAVAAAAEQQARVRALGRQIALLPADVGLYREDDPDTRMQAIDASLIDLRAQLSAARVHYRDGSRKVAGLLAQLDAREGERQIIASDRAPSVVRAGRSPALDGLLLDRAHAVTEQAAAAARAAVLRGELADVAARLGALTGQEAALADLQRRKSVADTAFASASQVMADQRMTEAEDTLRLANVRVIQRARVPQREAPIPLLVVLAGGLLGAAGAGFWCVAGILFRPTAMTPEGLAHASGLPVLGVFFEADEHPVFVR